MSNVRRVFFIGVVGGLVGYACGAAFTPTRAVAQQINPADAGPAPADPAAHNSGTPAAPNGPQPACRQWQVKVDPRVVYSGAGEVLIDEGWEPFSYSDGQGSIILRRCVR